MSELIKKVAEWFEKMKLNIIRVEGEPRIIMNYKISDFVFQVQVLTSESWINIKALIAYVKDLSESDLLKVYHRILVANWELNEVTFSADPENGNIWCETDTSVNTSFENFEVKFNSIHFAVKYFLDKIAPTVSIIGKNIS